VLEIVNAYSKAINKEIPYSFTDRRPGDVSILQAIIGKANKELEWKTEKNVNDMCLDSYNFILKNPNGIK
jgi:UDP-glucose 4-epimerase